MPRDNQVKGKQAGNQNEGRQQMDRGGRAGEAGRSGGHESLGTAGSTDPVQGETKERSGGGNQGGGSARPGER